MNMIVALGVAGGFLFAVRGWITLFLIVLMASQVSQGLAMAFFKEALKAGWFDEAR